jgi:hypothetical protein
VVPFLRSDFTPNQSLVQTVRPNEAYYFSDGEGKLNIALRYRVRSVLGRAFNAEWSMSMVLEGFPAGSEKLYKLNTQSVRIVRSYGGDHTRSSSLGGGIALIYAPKRNRLKGRFHVTVRQQRFSVLKGWSFGTFLVTTGEFEAVENPIKGRQILERTQEDGFGRGPETEPVIRWIPPNKASTQPGTPPATGPEP